jgi:hypothetical protein
LDLLFSRLAKGFAEGDPEAVSAGIRILARRARLLGLDMPIQQDIVIRAKPLIEYTDEELAILLERANRGQVCPHCGKWISPATVGVIPEIAASMTEKAGGGSEIAGLLPQG